jgi:hypothetical protein
VRVRIDTSAGHARMMAIRNPVAAVPRAKHELAQFVGSEIIR